MLQLDQRLLDRDATQPQGCGDLVAVNAITGAQPTAEKQLEDVRDNLVFFLDAVAFGHGSFSRSREGGGP